MPKIYQNINVYEAWLQRIKLIFDEFDCVVIPFSGGKDSGVLYNLVAKYMRENGIKKKVIAYQIDVECQYETTINHVKSMLESHSDIIEPWLICLPFKTRNGNDTAKSSWYPWLYADKEKWFRPIPDEKYVICEGNNPFPFYKATDKKKDFYPKLIKWLEPQHGKVASLVAIRADESLHRYRAVSRVITNPRKENRYHGLDWSIREGKSNNYRFYPLYDWTVNDVWVANGKFNFDYNKAYDKMTSLGIPLHEQRIASFFIQEGQNSLKTIAQIEPETWARALKRVEGVNMGKIYANTKAVGKDVNLPKSHTWQSYAVYLTETLPADKKAKYEDRLDSDKGNLGWAMVCKELLSNRLNQVTSHQEAQKEAQKEAIIDKYKEI